MSGPAGVSTGGGIPLRHPLTASRSSQNLHDGPRSQAPQSYTSPSYTQHQSGIVGSAGQPATPISMAASSSTNNFAPLTTPTSASVASTHSHSHSSNVPLTTKPAVIEHGNYRFCVHDAPTDSNLPSYVDFLLRKRVVALVRACEPTYESGPLQAAGIRVIELPFQDGSPPPDAMISRWLELVHEVFGPSNGGAKVKKDKSADKADKADKAAAASKSSSTTPAIAVHCVAGLGRAPVLVCIALIESGMHWMAAVELVRKKRRGALNITQLQYLEAYKPRGKKDNCNIM